MKLTLNSMVLAPTGKPITAGVPEEGKLPIMLTTRMVIEQALSIPLEEDLRHGTARYVKLGDLLKAVSDADGDGEIDLKAEDIALIKERVPHCYRQSPQVVWGALQALEGAFNGGQVHALPGKAKAKKTKT